MKIALAQLSYTIGDFKKNQERIINAIEKAKSEQAELIVFSELSICGYHPLDLLENSNFVAHSNQTINQIAEHCKGITAIVGAPSINTEQEGKKLYNSAVVLSNGQIQDYVHKTVLLNYDISDESRYFEPNKTFKTIQIGTKSFAITICEDLWHNQVNCASTSPLDAIKEDYDYIINIAGSPFSLDQSKYRKEVLTSKAKKHQKPLIYVNQSSANTEFIFDGQSMLLNAKGEISYEMKRFEEDFQVFDLETFPNQYTKKEEDRIEVLYQALCKGLGDYFDKLGFKKAVLGLSGGIDSALVASIATQVLGKENVVGILMPSKFSSDHSITDAKDLAKNLGIEHHIIPIGKSVDSIEENLNPLFKGTKFGIAEENIQARTRGLILMAYSNKFGHILLNTSNKSECAVGYGTLYGDMSGGLSILGDVYKKDVFALSRYINKDEEIIPWHTINKPPSAELRPDQKDSDSLPDYEILDTILKLYIEHQESESNIIAKGFDSEIVKKILALVNKCEYKRYQAPPIIRVSNKAFGSGRRIPLIAKYNW